MENKHWYAVQENEEDALDYGSYDYNEALEMAQVVEHYSSRDALAEMEITDIMFYLAEICTTTFEIEK